MPLEQLQQARPALLDDRFSQVQFLLVEDVKRADTGICQDAVCLPPLPDGNVSHRVRAEALDHDQHRQVPLFLLIHAERAPRRRA
ncbi:MAG: hypothetical protein H0X16_09375 [Chloroflexi bacterium]|nr:hypothetical protein [Chloroflexota bacterium]